MERSPGHSRNVVLVCAAALLFVPLQAPTVQSQSEPTEPPYPPPGQRVDVGGWRLHLNCMGKPNASKPTVILEAGNGDFSVEWSLVQARVARFARVCSYDRAGSGWSDLGPRPRTMQQLVYELRTLLQKAGVTPPYVLVGHSFGGVLVRLYQSTYPAEVVGMVLIDGGNDQPWRYVGNKLVRLPETATGRPVPPVKISEPVRESDIPPDALRQIEAAARRNGGAYANPPPRDKLPLDAQRMRSWGLSQLKHYAANDNSFEAEELAAMVAERKKMDHPLGDLPLVVLTSGLSEEEGEGAQQREEERMRVQAGMGPSLPRRQAGHRERERSSHPDRATGSRGSGDSRRRDRDAEGAEMSAPAPTPDP